jgi:hypothetical protein
MMGLEPTTFEIRRRNPDSAELLCDQLDVF